MIRKQIVLLFLCIASSFIGAQSLAKEPNDSEGEIRYISDDLFTYLHAGPGRNFRILGTVVAGTRGTLISCTRWITSNYRFYASSLVSR